MDPEKRNADEKPGGYFSTTKWSVVQAAKSSDTQVASKALSTLCEDYWQPIYAYLRRSGRPAHEAQDLTQEFFGQILSANFLDSVQPASGRFRSYLLACLKHFLANEWRQSQAQRRGGGCVFVEWDDEAEARCLREHADDVAPETVFDRRWAVTLLGRVLKRLAAEFEDAGKPKQFEILKSFLTSDQDEGTVARAGGALGLNAGALRVAVHRLRKRYRERVLEEIDRTVPGEADRADELRYLIQVLKTKHMSPTVKDSL